MAREPQDERSIVVTGSSAGGVEALIALAGSLPDDFRAPIVIVQHGLPSQEPALPIILQRHTSLPVVLLEDDQELVPGTVYVLRPEHDVAFENTVRVTVNSRTDLPRPSIDAVFSAAADFYREACIAVVLSGAGDDGLEGVHAVKNYGGTVIVQDPATTAFPAMPQAIPPMLVDFTLEPERIGPVLKELVDGSRAIDQESEQRALSLLLEQVREASGVDFSLYKAPTITRRLSRLMVAAGTRSVSEYYRSLQGNPEGFQRIVSAFLIKVTEFFRDPELFAELGAEIIPQLLLKARETGELRIWSAGTSTGEEAYSLAILVAEALREQSVDVSVRIFATDVDEEAIAFARSGIYDMSALRNVSPSLLDRYFVRTPEGYEVGKRIRAMTVFGQHDLGQRAPFPRIDLCTCRNVLIYFTRELQQRALELFAFSVRDGGYLVLGKSESSTPLGSYFRPSVVGLRIFQRRGERVQVPATSTRSAVFSLQGKATLRDVQKAYSSSPGRELRITSNEVIGDFASVSNIGIAIVDRHYDVIAINSAARLLLDVHGVAVGDDFLHLVRGFDPRPFREIIDAALKSEAPEPREISSDDRLNPRWLFVSAVTLASTSSRPSSPDMVGIFCINATNWINSRSGAQRSADEYRARLEAANVRLDDLSARQRMLLSANDELATSNGELRSLNEQLLIAGEETASANEEIETLNEEMQATNEELETMTEELQAAVEELNTTNDELAAQTEDLARESDLRRRNLEAVRAERDALARVVQLSHPHDAVVDSGDKVIFVPSDFAAWASSTAGRWWQLDRVEIAGVKFALSRSVSGDLTFIRFEQA